MRMDGEDAPLVTDGSCIRAGSFLRNEAFYGKAWGFFFKCLAKCLKSILTTWQSWVAYFLTLQND